MAVLLVISTIVKRWIELSYIALKGIKPARETIVIQAVVVSSTSLKIKVISPFSMLFEDEDVLYTKVALIPPLIIKLA